MKWKIEKEEFLRTYPGYELGDEHTIIEHNGNIIHAANGSRPKIYKKSEDIVLDVCERIGDIKVNWKLFISFDGLRPLLTEDNYDKLPERHNVPIEDSVAPADVQRAKGRRIESDGPSAPLHF